MPRVVLALLLCGCAAASAQAAGPPAPPVLSPPISPACISSPFGFRHAVGPRAPAGFHRGIDLPAPAGSLVHAAAAGEVVAIRREALGGLTVFLRHPGGWTTLYAHLGSVTARLAQGRRAITAGEPIGRVGRTGITYGTHLFFAVLEGNRPIDPEHLLSVPRCGR
jgi:murein DD-endopeptidase MepM/ murein hydrolase activator NlpD